VPFVSTNPTLEKGDLEFDDAARAAFYRVVSRRRDIRAFQSGRTVPAGVLERILEAANQAPSVGYSQPWDFIVVRDPEVRRRIRANFLQCREAEAARYSGERRTKYLAYRLEGIEESALNVCVTVDLRSSGEPTLGTTMQPGTLRSSACCAIQNFWLAARAEGLGVGWVSILDPEVVRAELALPEGVELVAYLCVGFAVEFRDRPMLEETGWRSRRPLADVWHEGRYGLRVSSTGT
jgi:5,6-dimethylbenzimidazole synthase